ncbi:hypothetical protein CPB83DRAFT_900042 [Crepidotus variabilis]|uniref:Uncharacterized protein n=1 Tax=Crepidotus variabilis TaxID=179855 RepID=A0A9P6E3T8_9AGAR|nr:hypothetical protein CPB83DRAFT_900042 [Crepidotus variabilis]
MGNPFSDSVPLSQRTEASLFIPSFNAWFLVKGKTLMCNISCLSMVSPILADARAAATAHGPMSKGTRDKPLRLPNTISYKVFRDFVLWFFRFQHKRNSEWTTNELQNIMELSHFWAVESG